MTALVQATSQFVATSSVTTGTVPLPTGWQVNDVVYIFATLSATTGTLTTPGGYSVVVASFHSNVGTLPTSATMAVFRKVLTASESDPAVTCTSGRMVAIAVLVRGANTTTPEDVAGASDDNTGITYPSVRAASVSPTNAAALLLSSYGGRNGTNAATITCVPPGGQTEINDQTSAVAAVSNAAVEVASEQLAAAGATGTRTATQTSSSGTAVNQMGASVAVRPALVKQKRILTGSVRGAAVLRAATR